MRRCGAINEAWQRLLSAAGLLTPEMLLDEDPQRRGLAGDWQPLSKSGLGSRRRWRWTIDQNAPHVFVKRYGPPPIRTQLDRVFRQSASHSRAFWEYDLAAQLRDASIPAPAPVGYVEEMRGPFEQRSAVILAGVPGDAFDRTWNKLLAQRSPLTRGIARLDLARRIGRFVAAFHNTGYCHRDLYLCHIFTVLDPAAHHAPYFALIDLARIHKPRFRRMRWIIKDLAQLDASARQIGASRTDRFRALLAYLNLQPGAPRARWYARRVARKSNSILRRIHRHAARAARRNKS